ncbi:UbiA family prenyltransferase [Geotalea sp. SG265]|uniref:UbiA family prenyltransferase n=1 Tax=Geotalea sp. SG265 TaxID=2922867 RepID=UPI001FAF5A42|nr:UbiA family prenyltransferase [Geotalea sp. SG265]
MEPLRIYLELCRVSNLPTVWINTLAACLLAGEGWQLKKIVLLLLGFSLMYGGGMALNDWLDADTDRLHRPDRPLPSGRIGEREVRICWLSLFTASLGVFYAAGGLNAFCGGGILLLFVITYNLSHGFSSLAVVPMAGCRFMIYIVSGIACAGRPNLLLLVLAAVQFGYILYITMVGRREKHAGEAHSRVPVLLAGVPLLDGVALALAMGIGWIFAGLAGGIATLAAQTKIKGD